MPNSSEFFDRLLSEMAYIPEVDPELLRGGLPVRNFEAGMLVGHFRLEHKLGEGGFGEVWLGIEAEKGRCVAIKTSRGLSLDPEAGQRFEQEIAALARLDHPSVIRLLDEGEDESGRRFFVMEFIEGQPLASRPSLKQLLTCFEALLEGLAHAHARGMVHRDLKPDNVFIDERYHALVKILDFGIAHTVGIHALTTEASRQMAIGTPLYMSPEQAAGHSASVGPASDLYSVGVMLYEALSGQPPFDGSALELCAQHMHEPPPPLHLLPAYADVAPASLVSLCDDLLTKEYRGRPEFVADVLERLREIIKTQQDESAATSKSPPTSYIEPTVARSWRLPFMQDSPPTGRDEEFQYVMKCVEQVRQQQRPALVVLTGPPGVGKSRLARWVAEAQLQSGLSRIIRIDLKAHNGFAAALQGAFYRHLRLPLLEPRTLRGRVCDVMGFKDETHTEQFVAFMLRSGSLSYDPDDAGWQTIAHKALRQVIAYPCNRPLIVWIEAGINSESLRSASIWLTRFVSQHQGPQPLLILWEGDEPDTLSDLAKIAPGGSLHLAPLEDEVEQCVARQLAPGLSPHGLEVVTRWCKGNPLFIRELLRDWWATGALKLDEDGRFSESITRTVPRVLSDIYSNRLETLLSTRIQPERIAQALCVIAWVARGLSQRMFRWALSGSDLTPEEILRQGWFTQQASWEARYSFNSEALCQLLTERSEALGLSTEHIHQALELLLRNSLATMIRSDWNGAHNDLQRGWSLLDAQPSAENPSLRLRLLNASARVHYRQRDDEGVERVADLLQARATSSGATRPRMEAAVDLWRGSAALLRSEFEQAAQHLNEATVKATNCQDDLIAGLAHHLLGRLALTRWSFQSATDHLTCSTQLLSLDTSEYLSHYVRDQARLTKADANCDLAEGHSLQGQHISALKLLRQAQDLYKTMEDLHGQAYAALHITRVMRRSLQTDEGSPGDQQALEQHLRHARMLMEQLNDRRGHALLVWEDASIASLQKRHQEALKAFETAALLFLLAQDSHGEALCINCCGEESRYLGRFTEALECYQRFYSTMEAMDNIQGMALARTNRGWVFLETHQPEQASRAFTAALTILKDTAPDSDLSIPYIGLALAVAYQNRSEAVLDALHEATRLLDGGALSDPDALSALEKIVEVAHQHGWDEVTAVGWSLKP